MPNRDYKIAFGVGVVSSVLWFFVLKHLSLLAEGELIVGVISLPFLFVAAVAAARKLFTGRLFHKVAKFLIVGVLNTGIDFFIFNTLIVLIGINSGIFLLFFKSISFIFAILNSYELNRLWTFDATAAPARNRKEFMRFAAITFTSFLVNVGTTTLIANLFHPLFGLSQIRWDNVAAATATVVNLILNFVGYKLFVFNVSDVA